MEFSNGTNGAGRGSSRLIAVLSHEACRTPPGRDGLVVVAVEAPLRRGKKCNPNYPSNCAQEKW